MLSLFFALFFAVPTTEISVCDRPIISVDESLYKDILLSSNDGKVKRKYLELFGNCIVTEGISLIEIRNIPVIEVLDCTDSQKRNGSEIFFMGKKLCSRSVQFYPSRKVFTLTDSLPLISIDLKWKTVKSGQTLLFYNTATIFEENQDTTGRKLKKTDSGGFINSIGKPAHPFFIYQSGEWNAVFPLRELFEMNVKNDKSFEVKIITEAPVPYEPEKLIETTGLKASEINVETPVPSTYYIHGKGLKGIRIPALTSIRSGESFHGTYIVRLSYPGLEKKTPVNISDKAYSITINHDENKKEFILTVLSKKLNDEETNKIKAVLNKEIPGFYIAKENDD